MPTHALSALASAVVVTLSLALGGAAYAADMSGDASGGQAPDSASAKQTVTISALSISGNTAFSTSQLQRAMHISTATWYSRGDRYSKALMANALANLRAFYVSRGYMQFQVKEVSTAPSPDGTTVAVSVTIKEGRLYRLASVDLTGDAGNLANMPGMAEALQRALPVGKPVSREGLEAARRAIIAQLGHQGYAQPSVSPRFITDNQNARIAVTFEVVRNQQELAQTNPVREGAVTPVPPASEPSSAQPPGTPPKSKTQSATAKPSSKTEQALKLAEEQREINLRASVGYSSTDRAIAMASARYLNALGKGWDLAGDIAGGKTYRAARLSESDRWFTPGGVSRSTSLWYRSDLPFYYLNDSRFRISSTGLTERFDIPVTASDSFYLAPGIERDWLGVDALTPQAYLGYINRYGSSLNLATLRAGWTHDMRDSASLPTRGYIVQGDAEFGFGDATYIKAYASGSYYHPLWGSTVLSLSGLGGFGQGLGSRDYPIEKYFYAGGVGSVRGYAANSLGPRDLELGANFPLGGRRLLVGSIEAVTPITAFTLDIPGRLVWLLFVDGGNVWDSDLNGTGAGSARFSYGTGLGWQIPYGTLKLSLGLPVKRHRGDDYQKFQVEFNAGF
ncbi:MAG: BamA/TamA family outer membrane protein [Burkholderiaceae bacterium]|jgi:outer membrane protein insertion porin family|nr:BamA/TamA family outer membrane protein [Burkholderiaceae bacterium]